MAEIPHYLRFIGRQTRKIHTVREYGYCIQHDLMCHAVYGRRRIVVIFT